MKQALLTLTAVFFSTAALAMNPIDAVTYPLPIENANLQSLLPANEIAATPVMMLECRGLRVLDNNAGSIAYKVAVERSAFDQHSGAPVLVTVLAQKNVIENSIPEFRPVAYRVPGRLNHTHLGLTIRFVDGELAVADGNSGDAGAGHSLGGIMRVRYHQPVRISCAFP